MTRRDNIDKAFDVLSEAGDRAWSAVQPLCGSHTDPETPVSGEENLFAPFDGDRAYAQGHSCKAGWLTPSITESPHVHLSPGAVNRLAQYRDRHRTDRPADCESGRRRER